eukprot:CAMPEP_0119304142 /NCGR_PEP_ID=MMETSP1333-20130426/5441_1 /TAXON_ID=418940 /ORGANISM="Scyphosphaera apsteinii, Strain RCC1455" /LENGTH=373 /DNA_ID=CAMNT_0007306971 /DNA_START=203 /DNA_END=1323 /DNA_ORIENTATION=+
MSYSYLSSTSSMGAGPNSLSLQPSGQIAVANYAGGTAALIGFDTKRGTFVQPTRVTTAYDAAASQVHFVSSDAKCGKDALLLVVDAGALAILGVDSAALTREVIKMPVRPRQVRLHPRLPIAYVVYEDFDSEAAVGIWRWPRCSNFSQMVPTEVSKVLMSSSTSRLYMASQFVLSPDSDFAYVCSRWPGFVTVLAVSSNGSLTPIQHVSLPGSNPRDCKLTKDGSVFLVTDTSSSPGARANADRADSVQDKRLGNLMLTLFAVCMIVVLLSFTRDSSQYSLEDDNSDVVIPRSVYPMPHASCDHVCLLCVTRVPHFAFASQYSHRTVGATAVTCHMSVAASAASSFDLLACLLGTMISSQNTERSGALNGVFE